MSKFWFYRGITLFLLILFFVPAHAISRCTADDGSVSYVQGNCPNLNQKREGVRVWDSGKGMKIGPDQPTPKSYPEQNQPGYVAGRCYESSIKSPTPFMGNDGEVFKLIDGSVWEVKYEHEYMYEYYPSVIVCPDRGELLIGEKNLNVELLSTPKVSKGGSQGDWEVFEETNLKGNISGTIQRGHIFKTTSGSIYEVTGLSLQLVLELQPAVIVLRNGNVYKLIVDGFDEPIICAKLK